jgi:hypothetical protein
MKPAGRALASSMTWLDTITVTPLSANWRK